MQVVTLTSSQAAANILLSYRVARLSMALTDIPTDVTAVNVCFSLQYGSYSVDGNYSNGGSIATVTCRKSSANPAEWTVPELHLFPGSGQQTVFSIALTGSNGKTETYGYTYTSPLVAATPYALAGSYKEGFSVRVNEQYRIEFKTTKVVSEIVVTVCNIIELSNHYK